MIDTEEEERVMEMIRTLPDKQQTILRMKHIDGMEVSEIARTTGMTEEAVRQNLSRARRRIISLFNR
jgi:RNA polymerase sigma-70 factor (ECF subfamily)